MLKSIVLIPTILSALLPSLTNGINFNPPIKNADPVSIIAWNIDDATKTSSQTLINQSGNAYIGANISKYNINKSNDYINIKETTYTQTIQLTNSYDSIYQIQNYYDYNTIRYETSAIIITEITTYSGITNNTIDYEISLLNNNYIGVYPEIDIDLIQYKTNNDLSEYINQTNYAILNNQLAIFTDITNNFSYTQTKNFNDATLDQSYNVITNIQLNNIWKTYMITYIKWIDDTSEYLTINGYHIDNDLFTMDTGEIFGSIYVGGGYEYVDIPNLMFTILTLPFSFISQAFNLTLFPNTPYSINIGNLFLSVVAI
ncbi:MAG: hypothetical protein WC248_07685, partial [Candidatus Methanomethylophilaceae archaeon]